MAGTRREEILETAATLFARRGFHGVSVTDLGAACGTSGPALYKHFASKQAMLAELLVGASDELLRVARERVAEDAPPAETLSRLVHGHLDMAIDRPAIIVVQDRDWSSLPDDAREHVRTVQRKYVDLWARELRAAHPALKPLEAKARLHAVFGLLNSTPHSALLSATAMRTTLHDMALQALDVAP